MAAITTGQLAELIQAAFDADSDSQVEPAEARARQAQKIAQAIEAYVVGRNVQVTGVQPGAGTAPGLIINT